jgi:hypothetical protein
MEIKKLSDMVHEDLEQFAYEIAQYHRKLFPLKISDKEKKQKKRFEWIRKGSKKYKQTKRIIK